MDIDTFKRGEDFVNVLQSTVASCAVLIAIIGSSGANEIAIDKKLLGIGSDSRRLHLKSLLVFQHFAQLQEQDHGVGW
jgi:hypothetical protein